MCRNNDLEDACFRVRIVWDVVIFVHASISRVSSRSNAYLENVCGMYVCKRCGSIFEIPPTLRLESNRIHPCGPELMLVLSPYGHHIGIGLDGMCQVRLGKCHEYHASTLRVRQCQWFVDAWHLRHAPRSFEGPTEMGVGQQ